MDFIKKIQETPDLYIAVTQAGPGADAIEKKNHGLLYHSIPTLLKS
jgi:hypothetical protein